MREETFLCRKLSRGIGGGSGGLGPTDGFAEGPVFGADDSGCDVVHHDGFGR